MAIYCSCACGKIVRFPDKAAGRRFRCPKCRIAIAVPHAPERYEAENAALAFAEGRGVFAAEDGESRTFWQDLLKSPFFVLEQGNLVTLLFVAAAHCFLGVLGYLFFSIGDFGLGFLVCAPFAWFLGAYYPSTLRQTAGGDDDLPDLWPTRDEDDPAEPLFELVGSLAAALAPAAIVNLVSFVLRLSIPLWLIGVLFFASFLLWPSTVLTVSLGGGIGNLLPRYVMSVIRSAPLAYLAVCLVVSLAVLLIGGLLVLLYFISVQRYLSCLGVAAVVFVSVLTAYAGLVGMRAVGLYYRHYKRDWPWFAE